MNWGKVEATLLSEVAVGPDSTGEIRVHRENGEWCFAVFGYSDPRHHRQASTFEGLVEKLASNWPSERDPVGHSEKRKRGRPPKVKAEESETAA